MNNSTKRSGFDTDLRSLLKHQHRRVYSICRFFTNNYKEHQRLFTDIIAAASQNIRTRRENSDKNILLLRACINMTALHSISQELAPDTDRTLQFKSPDFQKSISGFRETMGELSDYDKFLLFFNFENVATEEIAELTGITPQSRSAQRKKEAITSKKSFNFIPYIKEKLIWS